jgi:hypothetical protein
MVLYPEKDYTREKEITGISDIEPRFTIPFTATNADKMKQCVSEKMIFYYIL